VIYFIENTDSGEIKIGYSRNPMARLRALQTATCAPLELLKVVEGDVSLERALHEKFRGGRRRGEWFDPTVGLLTYIQERGRSGLVGQFFLLFGPDKTIPLYRRLKWQGRIETELRSGDMLVQLFSWCDGSPTDRVILKRRDTERCVFFETERAWGVRAIEILHDSPGATYGTVPDGHGGFRDRSPEEEYDGLRGTGRAA